MEYSCLSKTEHRGHLRPHAYLEIKWNCEGHFVDALKVTCWVLVGIYTPIWIRLMEIVYFQFTFIQHSLFLLMTSLWEMGNMVLGTFFCFGRWGGSTLRHFPVLKPPLNANYTSTLIHLCKLVFCGFFIYSVPFDSLKSI